MVYKNNKIFSDMINKPFCHPATKQKGDITNLNIVKMKDVDFNKLRTATTAWPSETETLFFLISLNCLASA